MVSTRRQSRKANPNTANEKGNEDVGNDDNVRENDASIIGTGQNSRKRKHTHASKSKSTSSSATNNNNSPNSTATTNDFPSVINLTPMNNEITKVKTAKICGRRWDALFLLRDSRRRRKIQMSSDNTISIIPARSKAVKAYEGSNDDNDYRTDDPFDCSDLIVPSSCDLVNREVEVGMERWKDLASRVVVEEDGEHDTIATATATTATGDNDQVCKEGEEEEEEVAPTAVAPLRNYELLLDANLPGDKRKQRLLPYNFDYACKKTNPSSDGGNETIVGGNNNNNNTNTNSSSSSDGHHCPKVISLLDPTQTISYEDELGNVFKSVKTLQELEQMHAFVNNDDDDDDGSPVSLENNVHSQHVQQHGCQHVLDVKNTLKEGLTKYTRLDAHSLGRLRIRERHSDPLAGATVSSATSSHSDPTRTTTPTTHATQTTIRFEILRHSQNLKRGSGTDGNRMEVEMHGADHTLLDLHRFLVECAVGKDAYGKKRSDDDGDGGGDVVICAGVFFIENTFYTCGEVGEGVGEAIRRWLDDKKPDESMADEQVAEDDVEPDSMNEAGGKSTTTTTTPRKHYLGLSPCQKSIPMSEMKLEDLPHRLGVRYYHMFVPPPTPLHMRPKNLWSLANESAVYVTGIHARSSASLDNYRHNNNNNNNDGQSEKSQFPIIIHDTWAPSQRRFCLACNYSLASTVVVNDPLADAPFSAVVDGDEKEGSGETVHLQGVAMCSPCYRALHYKPHTLQGGEENGDDDRQPLLELRSEHQPGLVFPIDDYQRMATASVLDEVPKSNLF